MEHVFMRKEVCEENGRRKKKEGDGVLRAVSEVEKERHGAEGDEEDTAGTASPSGEGHRIVRAYEAYPKGMDPHNDLVTNYLDRKYYRHMNHERATRERKNTGPHYARRALSVNL